jgi:hypothetical protein
LFESRGTRYRLRERCKGGVIQRETMTGQGFLGRERTDTVVCKQKYKIIIRVLVSEKVEIVVASFFLRAFRAHIGADLGDLGNWIGCDRPPTGADLPSCPPTKHLYHQPLVGLSKLRLPRHKSCTGLCYRCFYLLVRATEYTVYNRDLHGHGPLSQHVVRCSSVEFPAIG